MSIVALKHKTLASKNISGAGVTNFSINSTHRNVGYVGRNSFFIPSTCCVPVDTTHVTPSVLSTKGMINTKYRWAKRGHPYTEVKAVNNKNNEQGEYIHRIKTAALTQPCDYTKNFEYVRWKKSYVKCPSAQNNSSDTIGAVNYETYLDSLYKKCVNLYDEPLVTSNKNTPFAC